MSSEEREPDSRQDRVQDGSKTSSPCISRHVGCHSCVPFGEEDQILAHFAENGFVVVSGVLDETSCDRVVDELWQSPQLLGRSLALERNDQSTWGHEDWPQQAGGKNFLESLDPYQDQACWELVQHTRVVHVLRLLWKEQGFEDIFSLHAPRWGVMRPTASHDEWRTLESWLHWDQNPWTQPGFGWVQCFVCLSPQTASSGGLLLAPGFHRRWQQWGEDHPEGTVEVDGNVITRDHGKGNPFPVPKDDPVHAETVRVLAPRGALVLWDSRLPHQNFPNTDHEAFRVVMYLSFSPLDTALAEARQDALRRKIVVLRALGHTCDRFWPAGLTELGRAVTGTPGPEAITDADRLLVEQPKLAQAIQLTVESGQDELQGDLMGSVGKMRKAEKIWPDIMQWHEVIFA